MGFFTEQKGEHALNNADSNAGRPLDYTPGTYYVQFDRGIAVDGSTKQPAERWFLYGFEGTVLETVHSYTAAENEVFEGSRKPGQRVAHKWDRNMKWQNISARNARNLAEAIIRSHGFEAAMRSRPGYWEVFSELWELYENGDSTANPFGVVADLVSDDPELFAGLVLKVVTDELPGKDGTRRQTPRPRNVVHPVDEATYATIMERAA